MIEVARKGLYAGHMPDAGIGILVSLLQAHEAVLQNLDRDLEGRAGIPLSWHEILVRLDELPEQRARMNELAQTVMLTPSGFTRLADRIEAAGLIARTSCPTDRRGVYLVLTDTGREALKRSRPVFETAVRDRIETHLTAEERKVLRRALNKIVRANPSDKIACDTG